MMSPLLGLGACATIGSLQSARPLPPRAVEVGVELSHTSTRTFDASSREDTAPLGVSVRVGLDPRTELGLRAGFTAPEVAVKRLLTDPSARAALSVAPSLGLVPSDLHGIPLVAVYGQAPLLAGLPLGDRVELVLAPKLLWTYTHALRAPTWGLLVSGGASAGVAVRVVGDNWLHPELTAAVPVLWAGPGALGSGGGIVVQGGVALRVGGWRR